MKNNRLFQFIVVFLTVILLCGCWDIKDINKRTIPLVLGISKTNGGEYKVTLQIPVLKNESQVSKVVTGTGETITSALGKIRTNSENAIDYTQIRLIVVQNHLAHNQKEFTNIVKFLMGSEEIPSRSLMAITDENVEGVLSSINDKLGVHASSIYDFFNKGADWAPEIFSTPVWEVYRSLFSSTKDIAVPLIRSGRNTVLIFEGSDILKKGEIMDRLKPEEIQLIRVLQNKNEKGKIESLGFASIMVSNSSIRLKPSLNNDKPSLSSNLNIKINVLERNDGVTNKKIMEELERIIEERFFHILKRMQESHTDIFGFGQEFQQLISYNELKNWRDEYFPDLKVNFEVEVNME
ncbi:Ger(x)C family spore germination protein [Peribacillus sp. SI8-4]|uniref:Ger(x)C family spore germination protein n=1 Tax=Peribacillus sp. SI8-4 TaxID=3048009 RepID=UPI0025531EAB|nr:Ger(x)C family spore germination protein [Peribacillus sp. SI8-4]